MVIRILPYAPPSLLSWIHVLLLPTPTSPLLSAFLTLANPCSPPQHFTLIFVPVSLSPSFAPHFPFGLISHFLIFVNWQHLIAGVFLGSYVLSHAGRCVLTGYNPRYPVHIIATAMCRKAPFSDKYLKEIICKINVCLQEWVYQLHSRRRLCVVYFLIIQARSDVSEITILTPIEISVHSQRRDQDSLSKP